MDRLRAKPPSKDEGKWSEGFLKDIMEEEEKAVLRDGTELSLTSELIKLFRSRVEGELEGSKVWYIKKE
ncbi:hypothetical protein HRED_05194 [Candidatus Haloredivivus sp. G17]|jgi:hypothetical protein|nr:hypothetical protein HRED_03524 [Candidatus Haloredivivus sp. G17]EHK02200.1 hypothetical protein HRED_05194 [Candidatus Haloredivivus sp. G17]